MSALRGLALGTGGLALLEATVSSQAAAGRVGGAFAVVSTVLARWLDPYTPLVPNLTGNEASPFGNPPGTVTQANIANLGAGLGSSIYAPRRLAATPQAPNQTA
jgi:hypothetical protein